MLERYISAWLVHLFTASTAIVGLLTVDYIYKGNAKMALWMMALAILIDAVDGSLARLVKVKKLLPTIDGALLDNMVDYFNYVLTPCLFILNGLISLPLQSKWIAVSLIALSSAYQFTQTDAKTPDHFFKGFPSYWNIVVFYLFLFSTSASLNLIILLVLCLLIFIPIKYVYPSRLDYLTDILWLRRAMLIASILYGIDCVLLLWYYPEKPKILLIYSFAYVLFYIAISIFRTVVPLIKKTPFLNK